jgi:hypothetical protein
MLGRMTGIGDRYKDKPLIYPVLHQSLFFSAVDCSFAR